MSVSKDEDKLQKEINWSRKNTELQLLYSMINDALNSIKDKHSSEQIDVFKLNMRQLILVISDNDVEPSYFTRYLIVMINKILLAEKETDFTNIEISGIKDKIDKIISSMIILYKQCQDEYFRSAMITIQESFEADCLLNASSPLEVLKRDLQELMWSAPQSGDKSVDKEKNIKDIEAQIDTATEDLKQVREFCEVNRVKPKTKAKG